MSIKNRPNTSAYEKYQGFRNISGYEKDQEFRLAYHHLPKPSAKV
jgi:hypothetical protein